MNICSFRLRTIISVCRKEGARGQRKTRFGRGKASVNSLWFLTAVRCVPRKLPNQITSAGDRLGRQSRQSREASGAYARATVFSRLRDVRVRHRSGFDIVPVIVTQSVEGYVNRPASRVL